jgi:hypothetical protein
VSTGVAVTAGVAGTAACVTSCEGIAGVAGTAGIAGVAAAFVVGPVAGSAGVAAWSVEPDAVAKSPLSDSVVSFAGVRPWTGAFGCWPFAVACSRAIKPILASAGCVASDGAGVVASLAGEDCCNKTPNKASRPVGAADDGADVDAEDAACGVEDVAPEMAAAMAVTSAT